MAVLAAGDTTTQLTIWIKANADGIEKHIKCKVALVTATGLAATTDLTTLFAKFINR